MARFVKKRDKSAGKAPGSLVFLGNQKQEEVRITATKYNKQQQHLDCVPVNPKDLPNIPDKTDVIWLNVDGLHDTDIIRQIGDKYELHNLMLEDILNTDQRPKHEEFDDIRLISMKMLKFNKENNTLEIEQVSLVIKENMMISFQEQVGDLFDPIRYRIRNSKGRIRSMGADYLAYTLMDSIVDEYLDIIVTMGDRIEELEDMAIKADDKSVPSIIYYWKRELRLLHRSVMPFRDMLLKILKMHDTFFKEDTEQFFKDLLDLSQQALDNTETYRDLLSDYYNIYNTGVSNRMNDVMKVLTVFASIFIPLTFIAGVYGTNFEYIPELGYRYSYFIMWGVMIILALGFVFYFRKKRWL